MFIYPLLFGLAFVYSNLLEWVIHKYVFHGLGKKRKVPSLHIGTIITEW